MLLIGDEPWKVDLTAWFQNDEEIHVALLRSPLTLPPPEEGLRTIEDNPFPNCTNYCHYD
jgi:hypothetical protein